MATALSCTRVRASGARVPCCWPSAAAARRARWAWRAKTCKKLSTAWWTRSNTRAWRCWWWGGGDSALEAAVAVAAQPNTRVTLSYRGAAFNRVKQANRQALDEAVREGRIDLQLETQVDAITPTEVTLRGAGQPVVLPNEAVIVCAGGILPVALLQQMGIEFQTKHGSA